MGKVKYLVGAAMVVEAMLLAANPALAETTISGSVPTQAQLDSACMAFIAGHPAAARFTARATSSTTLTDSTNVTESEHVQTYEGEASFGGRTLFGPFKNPGNDKNIFGLWMYTTQTFPTITETWTETTVVVKHVDYRCSVYNKSGNLAGAEWQNFGGSTATWTETTVEQKSQTTPGGTVTLTEPVQTDEDPLLVCNYTDRNGWRAMNNYDASFGQCSNALRDSAEVFTDI